MARKLTPVHSIPTFCVIIRAIHERGPTQDEAIAELKARCLWLSEDQAEQAGLPADHPWRMRRA